MILNNANGMQVLTLVVGTLLPILVALVTRRMASSGLKATALALLAAITGFLSELLQSLESNTAFDLQAAIVNWFGAFVIAVAVHYGLWKPIGLTGTDGAVALKTSSFGVGKEFNFRDRRPGAQEDGVDDHAR